MIANRSLHSLRSANKEQTWMIQQNFPQSQTNQWITKRMRNQPQKTSTMNDTGIMRSPIIIPNSPIHLIIREHHKRESKKFPKPRNRTQSRAHRRIVITRTSTRRYQYRNTERFIPMAKDSIQYGHPRMKARKCHPKKPS